jgi:hypothetical protein
MDENLAAHVAQRMGFVQRYDEFWGVVLRKYMWRFQHIIVGGDDE